MTTWRGACQSDGRGFYKRFCIGGFGLHLRSFVTATKPNSSSNHNLKFVPLALTGDRSICRIIGSSIGPHGSTTSKRSMPSGITRSKASPLRRVWSAYEVVICLRQWSSRLPATRAWGVSDALLIPSDNALPVPGLTSRHTAASFPATSAASPSIIA